MDRTTTDRLIASEIDQHESIAERMGFDSADAMFHASYAIEEAASEMAAELANERYFEDRGYDEARAFEDWEASRGVIPFDVAMREAERSAR